MPELPEVETVVRDLRPHLAGRRIRSVESSDRNLRRPWSAEARRRVVGRRFEAVERRGKWIVLRLDDGQCLVVHLGMSGQFTVRPGADPRESHTHVIFGLDDGSELRFRDIRRFGSVTLHACAADVERQFEAAQLGPEPFDLEPQTWRERLCRGRRPLKAALLDQRLVAGVGNIYADEALFEARLHPGRVTNLLSQAEAERLRKAIVTVLRRAIDKRGSSIRNYVGGSGLQGGYQDEFRAYGRTGEPCRRCKKPLERVRLAGRSTHFCPKCQK